MKNQAISGPDVIKRIKLICIVSLLFLAAADAQNKVINHQTQSWISINTTAAVSKHWAIILDLHDRRTDFAARPSFEFVRTALQYNVDKNLSFAAGYGHMWLHPSTSGWKTISNENRIYQQIIYLSKFRNVTVMQRIRNEQRWQQKIVADKQTGQNRFTNRFRYLLSLTIPVFKDPHLPALNVSDEIALQAGKEVVYNPFDQNRFFVGIKEKLTKDLSFDAGYMVLYQQKYSGSQYDLNNTYRLFFYYTPNLAKKHKS